MPQHGLVFRFFELAVTLQVNGLGFRPTSERGVYWLYDCKLFYCWLIGGCLPLIVMSHNSNSRMIVSGNENQTSEKVGQKVGQLGQILGQNATYVLRRCSVGVSHF